MNFLARFALALLISTVREKRAQANYALMGGGSPLLAETENQAVALKECLESFAPQDSFGVFIAMRHSTPTTEEAIRKILGFAPEKIILLPLYPQFSTTTTESSFKEFDRLWKKKDKAQIPVSRLNSFPTLSGFVFCLVEGAQALLEEGRGAEPPRLLLSAHGLPESIVEGGDPYVEECKKTVEAFSKQLARSDVEQVLCFQSRVGRQKWTGPSLVEEVERAGRDKKPVIVVPIAFVSEHVETLVELQIEARDLAEKCGVPGFYVVSTPRNSKVFMESLAKEVLKI